MDGIQCRPFFYAGCVKEVCEAERNWRGKSSQLIDQQHENKTNFDQAITGAIYFTFRKGKKSSLHRPNYTSIQVSCLDKNVEKKSFDDQNFFS